MAPRRCTKGGWEWWYAEYQGSTFVELLFFWSKMRRASFKGSACPWSTANWSANPRKSHKEIFPLVLKSASRTYPYFQIQDIKIARAWPMLSLMLLHGSAITTLKCNVCCAFSHLLGTQISDWGCSSGSQQPAKSGSFVDFKMMSGNRLSKRETLCIPSFT